MKLSKKIVLRALQIAMTGTISFQVAGCSLGDFRAFASNFNPCGTILSCDPATYNFLTSGYEGPGVDPDIDPACTYPPYCPNDPFVGNVAP